jgi:hypothetical protein
MAPFLKFVTFVAAHSLLHNIAYAQSTPDTGALVSSILGAAGEAVPTNTGAATATATAASSGGCPAVWSTVASDLKADMKGCNDIARSAIRFAFHDAGEPRLSNIQYQYKSSPILMITSWLLVEEHALRSRKRRC